MVSTQEGGGIGMGNNQSGDGTFRVSHAGGQEEKVKNGTTRGRVETVHCALIDVSNPGVHCEHLAR